MDEIQDFEVDAKVDDSLVEGGRKLSFDQQWEQVRLMVQSLLADRFNLKVGHETRTLPVYELVLAKDGPKFDEDNSHLNDAGVHASGPEEFDIISVPLDKFAWVLEGMVAQELGGRRLVLDKTGPRGHYSFKFNFHWMGKIPTTKLGRSADDNPSSDSSEASLFTSLKEQLGLKLESTKAPIDTLVIKHIEQPSEN
jgi:uncharacterized protein (TIGR03435 family)